MSPAAKIPRRILAGTSLDTSVLSIRVDPGPATLPEGDRRTAAALRRLLDAGVTTFDLARVRSFPRAASLLLSVLTSADPRVRILVSVPVMDRGGTGRDAPTELGPPDASAGAEGELLRSLGRLGSLLLERDLDEGRPGTPPGEGVSGLAGVTVASEVLRWNAQRPARSTRSPFPISGEFSLLETAFLTDEAAPLREGNPRIVARNPFADGRLDGTRFSSEICDRPPSARPVDLRALHAEFDPVLRLASLTRGAERTLAQAALQFVLFWPWVATTILPAPSVERWSELEATFDAPPLSGDLLEALDLVPGRVRTGTGVPSPAD
jgi:aryl-alcohol dehydrogenase-like predicted oxidoreductase